MSKTREEKIRDLAAELRREFPDGREFSDYNRKMLGCPDDAVAGGWSESIAEHLLDAVEREEPKWPTKESFNAALEVFSNFDEPVTPLALQSALAAAMHADPIIQAAVEWVKRAKAVPFDSRYDAKLYEDAAEALVDAVKEAGLLT